MPLPHETSDNTSALSGGSGSLRRTWLQSSHDAAWTADDGVTFHAVHLPFLYGLLTVDPNDGTHIFLGDGLRLLESHDSGGSWTLRNASRFGPIRDPIATPQRRRLDALWAQRRRGLRLSRRRADVGDPRPVAGRKGDRARRVARRPARRLRLGLEWQRSGLLADRRRRSHVGGADGSAAGLVRSRRLDRAGPSRLGLHGLQRRAARDGVARRRCHLVRRAGREHVPVHRDARRQQVARQGGLRPAVRGRPVARPLGSGLRHGRARAARPRERRHGRDIDPRPRQRGLVVRLGLRPDGPPRYVHRDRELPERQDRRVDRGRAGHVRLCRRSVGVGQARGAGAGGGWWLRRAPPPASCRGPWCC